VQQPEGDSKFWILFSQSLDEVPEDLPPMPLVNGPLYTDESDRSGLLTDSANFRTGRGAVHHDTLAFSCKTKGALLLFRPSNSDFVSFLAISFQIICQNRHSSEILSVHASFASSASLGALRETHFNLRHSYPSLVPKIITYWLLTTDY
jgi:hypothetical protein